MAEIGVSGVPDAVFVAAWDDRSCPPTARGNAHAAGFRAALAQRVATVSTASLKEAEWFIDRILDPRMLGWTPSNNIQGPKRATA